jgi:hypothetical protein
MTMREPVSRLDKPLSKKFVFKLAQTKEELEACFRLLHDERVRSGRMEPDPSGMWLTLHHVLPTTSMLMCRYGTRVIGTVSLIRENSLGFPMQQIFDLNEIFRTGGNVAEVSALAIDSRYRRIKNRILIPLLKFLYEYAEYRFDIRHLLIAAHPWHISFCENVLCFSQLPRRQNSAQSKNMLGAHLDLEQAKERFSQKYADAPLGKNLYHYFTVAALPNGQFPHQRFDATTDPVMTPERVDYFFNQKTKIFSALKSREIRLLHAIYSSSKYRTCLPPLPESKSNLPAQKQGSRRYPVKCPAHLRIKQTNASSELIALNVYECSETVICVQADKPLSIGLAGEIEVELGSAINKFGRCTLPVEIVRLGWHSRRAAMMNILNADAAQKELWLKFIRALTDIDIPIIVAPEKNSYFDDDDPLSM